MSVRNYFCFQPCISSIITWPLIFSHISISPVKLSRLTALTGSLSQCRLFWERIQNCMSSQAWACSHATQPYSLSTMWHALLWTEVSVSVSSSDTLPGRCEALQGLTYYSVPEGRNPLRGQKSRIINSGIMYNLRKYDLFLFSLWQKRQTSDMLHSWATPITKLISLAPVCIEDPFFWNCIWPIKETRISWKHNPHNHIFTKCLIPSSNQAPFPVEAELVFWHLLYSEL